MFVHQCKRKTGDTIKYYIHISEIRLNVATTKNATRTFNDCLFFYVLRIIGWCKNSCIKSAELHLCEISNFRRKVWFFFFAYEHKALNERRSFSWVMFNGFYRLNRSKCSKMAINNDTNGKKSTSNVFKNCRNRTQILSK